MRAVVMTTADASSPEWHRQRLREIDLDHARPGATRILLHGDGVGAAGGPIVLRASAPGLEEATISVPTSVDPADGVMEVAARSAGTKVSIE